MGYFLIGMYQCGLKKSILPSRKCSIRAPVLNTKSEFCVLTETKVCDLTGKFIFSPETEIRYTNNLVNLREKRFAKRLY